MEFISRLVICASLLTASLTSTSGVVSKPTADIAPLTLATGVDSFSPRSDLMTFLNPLNWLNKVGEADYSFRLMNAYKEQCDLIGGTLVNNECYEYANVAKTFEEASADCQARGGHLWTPNWNDPFLFQKLVTKMPEIGDAFGESSGIYAGATVGLAGQIFDVNGNVAEGIYINLLDDMVDNCVMFEIQTGINPTTEDCSELNFYICEYPLVDPGLPPPKINPLQEHLILK